MCKLLNISRTIVYYDRKNKCKDIELEKHIVRIFKDSKNNYGSRKIKVELQKLGYQVSLKRIRKYMNLNGLVSNYNVITITSIKLNTELFKYIADCSKDSFNITHVSLFRQLIARQITTTTNEVSNVIIAVRIFDK